jgi:hypothetical protein
MGRAASSNFEFDCSKLRCHSEPERSGGEESPVDLFTKTSIMPYGK